jgi:hypothetical protein
MLARLARDFSDAPSSNLRFVSFFAPSVGGWANVYEAIRGPKAFGGVVE